MIKTHATELKNRANVLFPRAPYLDQGAVEAARRGWVRAVVFLRTRSQRGWVMDRADRPQPAPDWTAKQAG